MGGSGGVGTMAIQLSKAWNMHVHIYGICLYSYQDSRHIRY